MLLIALTTLLRIASEDRIMLLILAHNIIHEFVVALLLVRLVWYPFTSSLLSTQCCSCSVLVLLTKNSTNVTGPRKKGNLCIFQNFNFKRE